ncbi:hypothetical protein GCM10010170_105180 [Dactylosporangium salmoneum]|uniref:Secreted protein n=2 Tax=Dactylosporangium salmoneum TaxID=53361 RepID=A0ABP5V5J4_9ACTN
MLIVAAALAVVMGGCVLLARRIRRRGLGGGLMSVAEEIYLPSARRSRAVVQAEVRSSTPNGQDPPGL